MRLPAARPLVVVTDPEAAEALVHADPGGAHTSEAQRGMLPFASAASSFGGDGEAHMRARARVVGAFSREGVDAARPRIAELAAEHARSWPRGRPVLLLSRMRRLADDVVVRVLLRVDDEERAPAIREALGAMLRTPGNPPLDLPGGGRGLLGPLADRLFEQRSRRLRDLLREEARHAAPDPSTLLGGLRADGLAPDAAVDELLPVLMAAQEPMSAALCAVLDTLARHPDVAARVAAGDDALRDAAIRETLRLRSPAMGSLRKLTAPLRAGRWELPAGVFAAVPLGVVQRDPRHWPRPAEWDPQRWLDDDAVPEGAIFRPFGGGARQCVGRPLAETELGEAVPAILRAVRLRPLPRRQEPLVLRSTIQLPKHSTPALVSATNPV
jgi:cytochrome P450 family 135